MAHCLKSLLSASPSLDHDNGTAAAMVNYPHAESKALVGVAKEAAGLYQVLVVRHGKKASKVIAVVESGWSIAQGWNERQCQIRARLWAGRRLR